MAVHARANPGMGRMRGFIPDVPVLEPPSCAATPRDTRWHFGVSGGAVGLQTPPPGRIISHIADSLLQAAAEPQATDGTLEPTVTSQLRVSLSLGFVCAGARAREFFAPAMGFIRGAVASGGRVPRAPTAFRLLPLA